MTWLDVEIDAKSKSQGNGAVRNLGRRLELPQRAADMDDPNDVSNKKSLEFWKCPVYTESAPCSL